MCLLRLMIVLGRKTNFCGFGFGWCGSRCWDGSEELLQKINLSQYDCVYFGDGKMGLVSEVSDGWKWRKQ